MLHEKAQQQPDHPAEGTSPPTPLAHSHSESESHSRFHEDDADRPLGVDDSDDDDHCEPEPPSEAEDDDDEGEDVGRSQRPVSDSSHVRQSRSSGIVDSKDVETDSARVGPTQRTIHSSSRDSTPSNGDRVEERTDHDRESTVRVKQEKVALEDTPSASGPSASPSESESDEAAAAADTKSTVKRKEKVRKVG